MSDETTLLPCPWCGKRQAIHKEFGGWILNTTSHDRKCVMRKLLSFGMGGGLVFDTEAEAIAAWNTRTHGTLTAEQVLTIAGKHQPDYCSDTHACFDWQAIADELNDTLGSGTCHITASSTDGLCSDNPRQYFELSCGHSFTLDGLGAPVACAVCGKAVER